TQHQFNIKGTPTYISNTQNEFKINKPLIGWNWGAQPRAATAFLSSQGEYLSGYNKNIIPDNVDIFLHSEIDSSANGVQFAFHSHVYYDNHAIFTKSMCYDPTLYIDPNDVYMLNKRKGDPSNPVFGFLNKRGRVLSDSNDVNYSR